MEDNKTLGINMKYKDILKELDKHIAAKMKTMKHLLEDTDDLARKIDKLYIEMQDIYMELEDVHPLIREKYPKQVGFFEEIASYKTKYKDDE